MAREDCLHVRVKGAGGGQRLVRRLNVDGDAQGHLAGQGGEHRAVFSTKWIFYRYSGS